MALTGSGAGRSRSSAVGPSARPEAYRSTSASQVAASPAMQDLSRSASEVPQAMANRSRTGPPRGAGATRVGSLRAAQRAGPANRLGSARSRDREPGPRVRCAPGGGGCSRARRGHRPDELGRPPLRARRRAPRNAHRRRGRPRSHPHDGGPPHPRARSAPGRQAVRPHAGRPRRPGVGPGARRRRRAERRRSSAEATSGSGAAAPWSSRPPRSTWTTAPTCRRCT